MTIKRGLSLTCHLPSEPVKLRADTHLLRLAVTNLVSNACKYTPPKGQIQLRLFSGRSRQAVIEVSDSGVGIPRSDLPQVFERFYRVDTERSLTSEKFVIRKTSNQMALPSLWRSAKLILSLNPFFKRI